jgi:hypothetical protein
MNVGMKVKISKNLSFHFEATPALAGLFIGGGISF